MKRKLMALLLVWTLLLSGVFAAQAEELQGKSGMKVTFNGNSIRTNYKTSDFTSTAVNMLPGDSLTCEFTLENTASYTASWYMSNTVRKSMEDKSSAHGGTYTYDLRYISDTGAETVLYDSSSVGGENSEGLEEATVNLGGNKLDNYYFLGNLSAGKQGTVRLTIALDGETQGNGYQDTLADLRMNFAAIRTEERSVTNQNTGGTQNGGNAGGGGSGGSSGRSTRPVRTGDETQLYPYYLAAGVSGMLLLFLFFFRRKKEEEDEEREA